MKEELTESKMEGGNNPLREFVRGKAYDSVDRFGVWKMDVPRAKTSEKGRTEEEGENRVGTSKPTRSVLARVYNLPFREMKPTF